MRWSEVREVQGGREVRGWRDLDLMREEPHPFHQRHNKADGIRPRTELVYSSAALYRWPKLLIMTKLEMIRALLSWVLVKIVGRVGVASVYGC